MMDVYLKGLGLQQTAESLNTFYREDDRTVDLILVTKPRSFQLTTINDFSQVETVHIPSIKIGFRLSRGFLVPQDDHQWMVLEALHEMVANYGIYCDPRAFSKIEVAMDWGSSTTPVLRFLPLAKHPVCDSYDFHPELECPGCGSQFYNPADPVLWLGTPIGYVHERCVGSILSDATPGR
jgi:hypothetical protein